MNVNPLRIYSIFLKNLYLLRRSFPRIMSLFYWVTVEILFWGFISLWLRDLVDDPNLDIAFMLLTALIFWDLFIRAQQSLSVLFLEDIWVRNVINVFASPIRPGEFVSGLVLVSVFQGLIAFVYVAILAALLYALNVWTLGFYIAPFFVNVLVFGWAIGLFVIGLLIRFGPSVEVLAWSVPFLFLPFSAVYYPVDVLPEAVQQVAFFSPPMHFFEGMRRIVGEGIFPLAHLAWGTGLNVVFFGLGLLFFYWMVRVARRRGLIARLITE